MKKQKTVLLFILACFVCTSIGAKPKTSRYEFFWSLFHPIAAIKVKKTYKKVSKFCNVKELQLQLDSFSIDGKLDAYRHIFYMAAFAQKVKPKKLEKLGKAHEKTNYLQYKRNKQRSTFVPDSMSCVMDLNNNTIGINLGNQNKNASLDDLKQQVITLITKGNAFYMLRNKDGQYLDCNNNIINIAAFNGKWFIPKCLIGLTAIQTNY